MRYIEDKFNQLMLKIFKEQNIQRFEKKLSWDNITSLITYSKYVMAVLFIIMLGRCIMYGITVVNTVPFLIEYAVILTLFISAKAIIKNIDKNSKYIVLHSQILTSIFSCSTFFIAMYYDIVIKPSNISVMMYIALLIVSVMFDRYPHDYILFYIICFISIVSFEAFFVPSKIFWTDTFNTVVVILCGSYIVTYRFKVKLNLLVKLEEEQKKQLIDAKTKMILGQMQPHFLYNVLATIRVLYKTDQEKADLAMDDFSAYLRANIDNSIKNSFITFSQELNNIDHYLNLEKLRYGEKLKVYFDIQDYSFYLPVLTLQPIVENAVKHGVGNKKGGGYIKLSTINAGDHVLIKIEDNGVGIDADSIDDITKINDGRAHLGLISVKERIEYLLGGTVDFKSKKGEGATVSIVVPKHETEDSLPKYPGIKIGS